MAPPVPTADRCVPAAANNWSHPPGVVTANIRRARQENVDAAPQTPTRSLVANQHVRIEVLAQGDGRGRVIVLLPSLGRGASDFDPIAERLAAGRDTAAGPPTRG